MGNHDIINSYLNIQKSKLKIENHEVHSKSIFTVTDKRKKIA